LEISPGPYTLPSFVRAGSPGGLRRAMLSNNVRLGGYVNYFQIVQSIESGKPVWFAWFYEVINPDKIVTEDVKGKTNVP